MPLPDQKQAPVVESILPSRLPLAAIETAALLAINVPFIMHDAAMDIAPSTIQNTLEDRVPLIKTMVELAPAENAPPNLKINTAVVSPCAFKVRVPATDPAAAIE